MDIATNGRYPSDIYVVFDKRSETYTGLLAYVLPYGNNKLLRDKPSWGSKATEPEIFKNEPTSGFVLNNRTAKTYGSNKREVKVRVHDPRGFEVEISVENLLYILEFDGCEKGKSLNGEYVYYWGPGSNSITLLPKSSPIYKEICDIKNAVKGKSVLKSKDLKHGVTYANDKGDERIYLKGNYKTVASYRSDVELSLFYTNYHFDSIWVEGIQVYKTFKPIIEKGATDVISDTILKADKYLRLTLTDEPFEREEWSKTDLSDKLEMSNFSTSNFTVFGFNGGIYCISEDYYGLHRIATDKKGRMLRVVYDGYHTKYSETNRKKVLIEVIDNE